MQPYDMMHLATSYLGLRRMYYVLYIRSLHLTYFSLTDNILPMKSNMTLHVSTYSQTTITNIENTWWRSPYRLVFDKSLRAILGASSEVRHTEIGPITTMCSCRLYPPFCMRVRSVLDGAW